MLSEDIKNLIRNQYQEYGSYQKVARLCGVSDMTVRSVILDLYKADKKRPGPKPAINRRETRAISRAANQLLASGSRVTAPKIQRECALSRVGTGTVQRKLESMDMTYQAAKKTIVLSAQHKQARFDLARRWIGQLMDWSRIVWNDEKRINSDGPDSWRSWMPRGRPISRNKRQQGAPALQVWGALIPGPIFICRTSLPVRTSFLHESQ